MCYNSWNSPHDPKVTGSNPFPATNQAFSPAHKVGLFVFWIPCRRWRAAAFVARCTAVQKFRTPCVVARTAHRKGLGDHHGLHYSGNVIPCSHGSRPFKVDRPRTNLGTRRGTAKAWPRTGIRAGMARRRRPLPRAPSHPSHFRRNSPDPVRQASQAENTRRIESRDQTARQTETCARLIRTY